MKYLPTSINQNQDEVHRHGARMLEVSGTLTRCQSYEIGLSKGGESYNIVSSQTRPAPTILFILPLSI